MGLYGDRSKVFGKVRMRMPSLGPAVTRAVSIAFAVAAVAVLVFTALADRSGGAGPAAGPTRPAPSGPAATASPEATVPGSVDEPPTPEPEPTRSHVRPSVARAWLRHLAGRWTQDTQDNYFRFQADGTGEWVAFGQKLWTGRAVPRDARTFDLSDPNGQGPGYWRVRLLRGGDDLYFAGTRTTYHKA